MTQPRSPRSTVAVSSPFYASVCVAWAGSAYAATPAASPTTASEAARQVCKNRVSSLAPVTDALARAKAASDQGGTRKA